MHRRVKRSTIPVALGRVPGQPIGGCESHASRSKCVRRKQAREILSQVAAVARVRDSGTFTEILRMSVFPNAQQKKPLYDDKTKPYNM